MDSKRLNNWIQSTTGLAVVIGLGLVIFELQQNREAIASQLSSEGLHIVSQLNNTVLGEQPAAALAKACENPNELTTAELVVLDHYNSDLLLRTERVRTLGRRGSFYDAQQWRENFGQWNMMFETAVGRAYWKSFPQDEELRHVGDEILANWDRPLCGELYGQWREEILRETQITQ